MQFRGDRRGQAIQIGAVLLLGALVISFSLYQSLVVPDQNREIEFNHNQQVQGQLQELRNGVLSTGNGGDGRSVSVQLGTRYPSRVVALNPGPPSGTLRTVGTADESVNATIANAEAEGEVGHYWTGANKSFNTGSIRYRPGYNEYANAPVTWYEHSVLFNRFRDSNLTLTGQRLVDGTDISLVTVNGSYDAARSGSVSVDVRSVSASATTVPVTNKNPSTNVTITVPTHLSEGAWKTLLQEERETGYVADVVTLPVPNEPYQLLRVELERGQTYDLQLGRVGVGTGVRNTDAAYLTDVAGDGTSVPEGGTTQVTVEVRDRFDNPVGGVDVSAGTQRGDSAVSPTTTDSDTDGEVTLTYEAPADVSGTSQETDLINASIDVPASAVEDSDFDPETPLNVTMTVKVDNSDGSGLGGGGGNSAYGIDWQDPTQTGVTCDPAGDPDGVCTVDASQTSDVDLAALTNPTAQDAAVDFSLNDSAVGSLSPTETTTDNNGEVTTTFTPEANGSVAAFVASGGSGDRLDIVVENVPQAGGGFASLRATSMPPYSGSQRQNVTFVPDSNVPDTEEITINLTDPQGSSPLQVDYNGPNVQVVRDGGGAVTGVNTAQNGDVVTVTLTLGSDLTAGTPVELRMQGVRVGVPGSQTDPYDVTFDRSDTTGTGSTTFDIAYATGLSGLSSVSASDLQSGQSGQVQTVSFTLDSRLPGGDQTLIELSDPQGAVSYSNPTLVSGSGSIENFNADSSTDEATLVYAAPSTGLPDGSKVEFEIDADVAPESSSEGTYTVGFSREDEDVAGVDYAVGAAPSGLSLDSPASQTYKRSSDSVDVTYSYSDANPDTTTITFDDGSNTATYTIGDSGYGGSGSDRNVNLDLSSPDSTTGSGFVEGSTYDITVEATDEFSRSSSITESDRLTIDETAPTLDTATKVDTTTIDVTLSDNAAGLDVSTIEQGDFNLDVGTIDNIDTSSITDGDTSGVVTIDLVSPVDSDSVTVSLQSDGVDDLAGNTRTTGSATAMNMDGVAPTFDSASKVDTTTIDVTLSDSGTGLDATSIGQSDFTLDTGSIDNIETSTISDGDNSGTVRINLASPVDSDTVTVSLQSDGVDDLAGNTQTTGSATVSGMDGVAPTLDDASRADDTSIDITLSDSGTGLDASSISQGDFTVDTGSIDSIDASSINDGDSSGLVQVNLVSPVDSDSVTVSIQSDGIDDLAGNTRTAGSATATDMDGVAPTLDGASKVDLTTIEVTLSDGGTGLDAASIEEGDFTLDTGTISSIDASSISDGDTSGAVTINLDSTVDADEVTVSLQNDGIDDLAGNTQVSGSATASGMDGVAPTLDSASRVDDTTIDVTLSDSGSGLDSTTIEQSDFTLDTGTISSIDASSISDGDTSGTVRITLASPVDSDSVTVSLQPDGINDVAGNVQTSGSATANNMDSVPPTVTVDDPNGGETLSSGTVFTINWTTSEGGSGVEPNSALIEYSEDGGSSWTEIASNEADDGSYDWSVPQTSTSQALVRISVDDQAGNTGIDQSDNTFTIRKQDASLIDYNNDGAADGPGGQQSGVSFSVTNNGGRSVTVTGIAISSPGAAQKVFEGTSSGGQWNREVFVASSVDGYLEAGEQNYNKAGYALGSGTTTFTSDPSINSGDTATFSIYEFRNGQGSKDFIDMDGESVTVTLTYNDGSTDTINFTG